MCSRVDLYAVDVSFGLIYICAVSFGLSGSLLGNDDSVQLLISSAVLGSQQRLQL